MPSAYAEVMARAQWLVVRVWLDSQRNPTGPLK